MGKCKKRTLYKSNSPFYMTREDAVSDIFKLFSEKRTDKHSPSFRKAADTISLFGISAEELSEAGVAYENLKALESILV